jgi:hypothetical protein
MFSFTGRNRFISMKSLWRAFKKLKNHPRRLFSPIDIHTYQKYFNPSGDPFPLIWDRVSTSRTVGA